MIPIIGINMLARGKDKKLYTEFCTGFFIWRQFKLILNSEIAENSNLWLLLLEQ